MCCTIWFVMVDTLMEKKKLFLKMYIWTMKVQTLTPPCRISWKKPYHNLYQFVPIVLECEPNYSTGKYRFSRADASVSQQSQYSHSFQADKIIFSQSIHVIKCVLYSFSMSAMVT